MPKILIVEDDADIAAIERDYLELSGYEVTICSDGTSGLNAALTENCDLLLLDLMLPGTDGLSICRAVREKKDIPILMVTALGQGCGQDPGAGFRRGRLHRKALFPQRAGGAGQSASGAVSSAQAADRGSAEASDGRPAERRPAQHCIRKNDAELALKNKEYELLLFLMRHPGQVFSREDLYEMIWGLESMGDNITVAVHMNRLREKIEDDPSHPTLLQTVWGVGYRLNKGER